MLNIFFGSVCAEKLSENLLILAIFLHLKHSNLDPVRRSLEDLLLVWDCTDFPALLPQTLPFLIHFLITVLFLIKRKLPRKVLLWKNVNGSNCDESFYADKVPA